MIGLLLRSLAASKKIVQNFELFPASGKTLAERLRVLAANCEELRASTGNPPLSSLIEELKTFE
jgi:hypothetical protein